MCVEAEAGAGAALVAAEFLTDDALPYLTAVLARQPAWSDLPVLVVGTGADDGASERLF